MKTDLVKSRSIAFGLLIIAALFASCKSLLKAGGPRQEKESVFIVDEVDPGHNHHMPGEPKSSDLLREGIEKKNAGDLVGAIELFKEAIMQDTTNLDAYFERATAYYTLLQYKEANKDDDYLYAQNYPHPVVYARIAQRYTATEQWAPAVEVYKKGISLSDTSTLLLLQLGNLYVHLSRFAEAIPVLERAIALGAPGTAVFYSNLGYSYSRTGDHKKAVFYLTKAIELNPTDRLIYAFRGLSLLNLRLFENAEADYRFYLEENPMDIIAVYNLGRVYYEQKKWDQAIERLLKVANLQPDYMDTYYLLGISYGAKNDYKTALTYLDKAVLQDPNKAIYYYNRGIAKGQLSAKADFCPDFRKALELGFKEAQAMIDQYCK